MIQNITQNSLISTMETQMAEIPSGKIEMRDDRKKLQWKVEIKPFLLAKFPVTQELYFEITKESPSTFKGNKLPVETVTWKEAILFCNLLSDKVGLTPCYSIDNAYKEHITFDTKADGFRLPTEPEWEYACRAGTKGIRYGTLDLIGWYRGNSSGRTHEVGLKEPNLWGLYDMLGNVWEWCSDIYDEQVYGAYRVFKGGGWHDEERGCIVSNRRRSHPISFKIDDLGFRIARNIKTL